MKKNLINIIAWVILIITNIVFCVYYFLKKYLGMINFYQVIYHLFNKVTGGGALRVVLDGIKVCYVTFLIVLIIQIFLFTNFKKYKISLISKKTKKEYILFPTFFSRHKIIFSLIFFISSLAIILHAVDFEGYIRNLSESTNYYEEHYVDTNSDIISFNGKKRNLILLYLESTESSLFSKDNNGVFDVSRIPELEQLAKDNYNFSHTNGLGGIYTIPSTSYTMASLIASTSGTPVLTKIGNDYSKYDSILTKVNNLGDVLKKENYNLEFMQGSDSTFAGGDKYFRGHGNYKIFDYNTAIKDGHLDKNYFVWWGFEDAKLFEYAKEEITKLSKKDEPFAFNFITMDTHFTDGYMDDSCKKPFKDKMSNAFACSSKKVGEFVSWVKEQPFYDDTAIVIVGDHLTMQSSYFKDYTDYQRTVYNVFINSKKENVNTNNRTITSFDLYPTILSAIGADIEGDRLGFGTNLFSDKQTLAEEFGLDKLSNEILKNSDYYDKNIY